MVDGQVNEVARTVGKAIEVVQEFGGFFSHHFGGTIEQWVGLWEDKLKYRRWENQLALMKRAEAKIKELRLEGKLQPLPMKIGLPLLEAASLEDDAYLQDLWANLLINATSLDAGHTVERSLITTLQNMSRVDALAFKHLYELREQYRLRRFETFIDETLDFGIPVDRTILVEVQMEGNTLTKRKYKTLEDVPHLSSVNKQDITKYMLTLGVSEEKAELSLWTLHQLGCIEIDDDHRQLAWFKRQLLYFTPLGIALYQACTLEGAVNGAH